MILNVRDRLGVLGVLPKEGDIVTLRIIRKLQEELSFTEKELKDFKIVQSDGRLTWDASKDKGKEIEIGEKANDIIVLALSKLNEQKKLQLEQMELYDMFISKAGESSESN